MSGNFSGQARALPFAGPAGAVITIAGLVASGITFVVRRLRPESDA